MEAEFIIENLSVSSSDKRILQDVNLTIYKNKITALIGMSGCGKTTLLRSLNRTVADGIHMDSGRILLEGTDIFQLPLELLRKEVGLIQQRPTPFPFSIRKNMTYALQYHGVTGTGETERRIREALTDAGLYDDVKGELTKRADSLSGGQQQRLCIARALALKPKVLLLDEPCSALDIKNTLTVEETLHKLKERCTIVIVTHNLSQAKRIADYAAYMENGTIVEEAEADRLFCRPTEARTQAYLSYAQ